LEFDEKVAYACSSEMVVHNPDLSANTINDVTGGMSSNHNSRFSNRKHVYAKARKELSRENLLEKFEQEEERVDLEKHVDNFLNVKEVSGFLSHFRHFWHFLRYVRANRGNIAAGGGVQPP
jgi:hypothetical protein